jgi:thiol:disulfide interchange protein
MARPNKRPEPKPRRVQLWIIVVVVLIAGGAVAAYLMSGHGTEPESTETATEPALITSRHLYSETADPKQDIAAALKKASIEHKRVIVDFGGDWCGDCQVLDIYLHQPPNAEILDKNFVLVHVWIGHMDQHVDIPAKYGIPLNKGVPALAVLAPNGEVLYAQRSGEFEKMREMNPASVTDFLNTWKS